jgi:DNA invertase Pin-like site-specific DNA recombinase
LQTVLDFLRQGDFLDMLGMFAEFETNLRKERQLEGVAKAKSEGKYNAPKGVSDTAAGFKASLEWRLARRRRCGAGAQGRV